jgi:exopolysaccharide biosynthesis polyprenyl glycosylphosphotransferase
VNVTERTALVQGAAFYDELTQAVGDRTLEIVDRRRRTARVKRRGWLVRRMLLLADVVGLTVSFTIAEVVYAWRNPTVDRVGAATEIAVFLLLIPAWIVVAKLYGLYEHDEERTDHSTVDDVAGVFHMITVGAWLFFAGAWLTGFAEPNIGKLVFFWALAVSLVTFSRAGARALARKHAAYIQNAVIVGAGDVGQLVARKLLQHPEYGINLVGFVDATPKERRDDLAHLTILGPPARLPGIVRLFDVERVIVAFSSESHEEVIRLIRSVKDLGVQVDVVPRLFELVSPGAGIYTVEGLPLIGLPPLRLSRSSKLIKRTMDVVLAGAGLILLTPLFALIAALIRLDSPGGVFFRQVRVGVGQTFCMFKFRTMSLDAEERKSEIAHLNKHARNGGDARMFKVPDDPRVTRVGRFLRRYALDELPQLINVLRGEMSLVGPRPLILEEDQWVDDWARKRLDLRPGMTGLWQSLGSSDIPFDEMVKFDYLYVTTWSLWNDCRLLLRTIPLVSRGGPAT